jgi:hypothetical protein
MKIVIALLLLVFVPCSLSGQAKPSTDDGESPDVRLAVIALRKACIPNMRTPDCRAANAKAVEARLRQNSQDVKFSVEGADNEILVETWQVAFDDPDTRNVHSQNGVANNLCPYGFKRVIIVSPSNMAKYEYELNCSTTPQVAPQQTMQQPATFHGLKLGVTLGSQLRRCNITEVSSLKFVEGKPDELCFYYISWLPHLVKVRHGVEVVGDYEHDPIIEVLMPAGSTDVADGTIESIMLDYDIGQADSILAALKEKYGKYGQQPKCEKSVKRTGIGVPVDSLECTWQLPWGIVWVDAPSTKIDILTVNAATTKSEEEALERQRKQSDKRKAEF